MSAINHNGPASTNVSLLPYDISNVDHIMEKHTDFLCRDIERLLQHSQDASIDSAVVIDNAKAKEKKELMASPRRWIGICIAECDVEDSAKLRRRRRAVANSFAAILRTSDDVDVNNLQHLQNQGRQSRTKPLFSFPSRTRRRGLPPGTRSLDLVRGIHEAEEIDSDHDDLMQMPTIQLSNSHRSQRARQRSYLEQQYSNPMMRISLKAVMNAQAPKMTEDDTTDVGGVEDVVTTLTHEAAVLRRDLYKHLAELDVAKIDALVKQSKKCSSDSIFLQNIRYPLENIKELTAHHLERITSHPTSPSMRLSAIIALDSLRELDLSDWGYRCILDELLESDAPWSLQFYAEIISECHAYEKPLRLLGGISKLVQQAVEAWQSSHNNNGSVAGESIQPILRAIAHILVRRRNILSSLSQDATISSPVLSKEFDTYKRLCNSMSVCFDSATNWISPEMSRSEREHVIGALQAEGILSLFCDEDSDDEETQPSQTPQEYPYPKYLSLRAAHDRMGPCEGFNRLLSHPASYAQKICTFLDSSETAPSNHPTIQAENARPFSSVSDDILTIIFSFLGYRSLARASQCCKSWKRAGNVQTLWVQLYFKKYGRRRLLDSQQVTAYFEEELVPGCQSRSTAERHQMAMTKDDYDWRYIFCSKYTTEKCCKAKTCNIVGCSYLIRRTDHAASHLRRHKSAALTQRKKCDNYNVLQMKVSKMHQELGDMGVENLKLSAEKRFQRDIVCPEYVLRSLVFPFLDFKDLLQPVCKLWFQMADSGSLWEPLYEHHFGNAYAYGSALLSHDWKLLFRSTYSAQCHVKGKKNDFGWQVRICPTIGCNKELRSKFEYDLHVLKHDQNYCSNRFKYLKNIKRDSTSQNTKRRKTISKQH